MARWVAVALMISGSVSAQAQVPDSTQGPYPQAVGSYSNGSLLSPHRFMDEGFGFVKLFRLRDRGWATFDLLEVVTRAAAALRQAYPDGERLQLGDASQHGGGLMSRHASHQNGLDIDLAFLNRARLEQDPWESERGFTELFVVKGRVTPNFDLERNWSLVKALVSTGRVTRIFVDPAIKGAMCALALRSGEYSARTEDLRRLRPLSGHADHLHVRISCPARSPECIPQEEPPAGSGCP